MKALCQHWLGMKISWKMFENSFWQRQSIDGTIKSRQDVYNLKRTIEALISGVQAFLFLVGVDVLALAYIHCICNSETSTVARSDIVQCQHKTRPFTLVITCYDARTRAPPTSGNDSCCYYYQHRVACRCVVTRVYACRTKLWLLSANYVIVGMSVHVWPETHETGAMSVANAHLLKQFV